MAFDIDRVRACYPALREGYAHFDGAAGTLVAARSAQAIAGVTGGAVANKTTAFAPGRRAGQVVSQARSAVANLLGALPEGIVFGQSATALTYLVARTLADTWRPGDEVVVTRLDHDANVRPWVQVAARAGATVRWAQVDLATGTLPTAQFAELVTERTRVVALTAASNAIGSRPDVAAIARIAHDAGALTYVDGVHATPHAPTDVAALGADFYVTSAYKWSGPHLAACAADPQLWQSLHPEKLVPASDSVPERFEHGTLSFELLAGMTGAVDHVAALLGDEPPGDSATSGNDPDDRRARIVAALAAAQAYEMDLLGVLVDGLGEIDEVRICAAPDDRCPTVAFRVGDQHPEQTSQQLGDEGICVFAGDYYAREYFDAAGLLDTGGAVRASIYHYTTLAEVQRLLSAIKRCL